MNARQEIRLTRLLAGKSPAGGNGDPYRTILEHTDLSAGTDREGPAGTHNMINPRLQGGRNSQIVHGGADDQVVPGFKFPDTLSEDHCGDRWTARPDVLFR